MNMAIDAVYSPLSGPAAPVWLFTGMSRSWHTAQIGS